MAQSYELDVALDSSGVTQGAAQATNALGAMRGSAGMVSTALKTAGIAAVAFAGAKGLGAAISAAAEFEGQLQSLRSTVGETEANVKRIRKQTMQLAADTGESTDQIVDGYRFARSAGLDMAEANELVATSTKAAAAGFGEQSELVRTATTAMNTWSEEVKSGSDFLDTMAAAAQNADIRVSEMAGAFRRNVNIASQLNLSLEETLGSLSAISGAVGNASRGGRLFQQVLAGLLKPTQAAAETINGVVGSVDNLHRMIREDGLVQALIELQDRLEANDQGMDDVFRSARRFEGALALVSEEGGRAKDIMGEAAEETNTIQKAFEESNSTTREATRTWQTFNNVLIELGGTYLPAVNVSLRTTRKLLENVSSVTKSASNAITDEMAEAWITLSRGQNVWDDYRRSVRLAGADMEDIDFESVIGAFSLGDFRDVTTRFQKELARLPFDQREEFAKRFSTGLEIAAEKGIVNAEQTLEMLEPVLEKYPKKAAETGDEAGKEMAKGLQEGYLERAQQTQPPESMSEMFPTLGQQGAGIVGPVMTEQQVEKATKTFEEIKDSWSNITKEMYGMTKRWSSQVSDEIGEFVVEGKANFEDLGRSFMKDFVSKIFKMSVMNPMMNQMFNLGGTSAQMPTLFGDTPGVQEAKNGSTVRFAEGDKFAAAQNMGDLQAQVGGGGGSSNVDVNVINKSGENAQVNRQQTQDGEMIDVVIGAVADNIEQGGRIAGAQENRYGINPQPRGV